MRRHAAVALAWALAIGGLGAIGMRYGESLWALTAPPDRSSVATAEAERERPTGRALDSVAMSRSSALAQPAGSAGVIASRGAGVAHALADPLVRLGARAVVPDAAPTEAAAEVSSSTEPGEPAFTMEVQGGRTIYRMNGDLVVDPDQQREEPVEVGFEYRFGKRGLEKVKLWEVRR